MSEKDTTTTTKSFVEHFVSWAFPMMAKKRDEETEKETAQDARKEGDDG